jgi:hypothetical protein
MSEVLGNPASDFYEYVKTGTVVQIKKTRNPLVKDKDGTNIALVYVQLIPIIVVVLTSR